LLRPNNLKKKKLHLLNNQIWFGADTVITWNEINGSPYNVVHTNIVKQVCGSERKALLLTYFKRFVTCSHKCHGTSFTHTPKVKGQVSRAITLETRSASHKGNMKQKQSSERTSYLRSHHLPHWVRI